MAIKPTPRRAKRVVKVAPPRVKAKKAAAKVKAKVPKRKPAPKAKPKPVCKGNGVLFNANTGHFKSCKKSRGAGFCDVPLEVLEELSCMFDFQQELEYAIEDFHNLSRCQLLSKLLPATCMRGWRITRFLGKGKFGYVFGSRNSTTNETGALKIQDVRNKEQIAHEISAHKKFTSLGLSPKIHSYCSTTKYRKRFFFLNMGRIDTTLYQWLHVKRSKRMLDRLVDRVFDIIVRLDKKGVTHGDLHNENIGFVYARKRTPGKIQVLDHSWSSTGFSFPELEIVQFMRTLGQDFSPRISLETISHIRQRCKEKAKLIFDLNVSRSGRTLDKRFDALHDKLRYRRNKERRRRRH